MLDAFRDMMAEASASQRSTFSAASIAASYPFLGGLLSESAGLCRLITIIDDQGEVRCPAYNSSASDDDSETDDAARESDRSKKGKPSYRRHRHIRVSLHVPNPRGMPRFVQTLQLALLRAAVKRDNKYLSSDDLYETLSDEQAAVRRCANGRCSCIAARQDALLALFNAVVTAKGISDAHDMSSNALRSAIVAAVALRSPASLPRIDDILPCSVDTAFVRDTLFAARFEAPVTDAQSDAFLQCDLPSVRLFLPPDLSGTLVAAFCEMLHWHAVTDVERCVGCVEAFRWRVLDAWCQRNILEFVSRVSIDTLRRLKRSVRSATQPSPTATALTRCLDVAQGAAREGTAPLAHEEADAVCRSIAECAAQESTAIRWATMLPSDVALHESLAVVVKGLAASTRAAEMDSDALHRCLVQLALWDAILAYCDADRRGVA